MNKEERQVKGSIHHTRGVIWADSDIFWINEFTGNFSDHDEQNLTGSYQH